MADRQRTDPDQGAVLRRSARAWAGTAARAALISTLDMWSSHGPAGVCAGLLMLAVAALSAVTALRRRHHDPGSVPLVVGALAVVSVAASIVGPSAVHPSDRPSGAPL